MRSSLNERLQMQATPLQRIGQDILDSSPFCSRAIGWSTYQNRTNWSSSSVQTPPLLQEEDRLFHSLK
ncbi:unnamed protein product [Larinioides sclopetarius]|uniref:Uncharacterized protein n=1 Tax=Larinioides sclopetarius TaxID=280406 RepID=A0AAV2A3N5_9ARAC